MVGVRVPRVKAPQALTLPGHGPPIAPAVAAHQERTGVPDRIERWPLG